MERARALFRFKMLLEEKFEEIARCNMREHGKTSLQLLHDIGFLRHDVLLGHCVFHAHHSWAHYPYVDDLKLLADSGASVAHAPYKYAKMGIMLESFERYRQLGINVALGTDTFPQDLISEMRLAGLMCRFAEGSFRVGRAEDVFDAATLGGARALGRDDLGRLAPGAKADIVLVDLRAAHFGAVHDPIRSSRRPNTSAPTPSAPPGKSRDRRPPTRSSSRR